MAVSRETTARGLTHAEVLAVTLYAEARGDGDRGMRAVGAVIANRLAWGLWGNTWTAVCLAPRQFSCWNTSDDANHKRLVAMCYLLRIAQPVPELRPALTIARQVIAGESEDQTHGADHYCTNGLLMSAKRPTWADPGKMTVSLGPHTFFKLRPNESETT